MDAVRVTITSTTVILTAAILSVFFNPHQIQQFVGNSNNNNNIIPPNNNNHPSVSSPSSIHQKENPSTGVVLSTDDRERDKLDSNDNDGYYNPYDQLKDTASTQHVRNQPKGGVEVPHPSDEPSSIDESQKNDNNLKNNGYSNKNDDDYINNNYNYNDNTTDSWWTNTLLITKWMYSDSRFLFVRLAIEAVCTSIGICMIGFAIKNRTTEKGTDTIR